ARRRIGDPRRGGAARSGARGCRAGLRARPRRRGGAAGGHALGAAAARLRERARRAVEWGSRSRALRRGAARGVARVAAEGRRLRQRDGGDSSAQRMKLDAGAQATPSGSPGRRRRDLRTLVGLGVAATANALLMLVVPQAVAGV